MKTAPYIGHDTESMVLAYDYPLIGVVVSHVALRRDRLLFGLFVVLGDTAVTSEVCQMSGWSG